MKSAASTLGRSASNAVRSKSWLYPGPIVGLPSGKFGANAAWLALNVIAYNLACWMGRLGGFAITCLKTWRLRFLALPGRLVEHARRRELRLSADWPWREQFLALLVKLRAVAIPSTG